MYVDVLKEIGNVGSGNAATAIANMVGTRIDMKVPNVKLMDVGKLGSAIGPEEDTVIGIFLEVSHDIDGSMMFLLDLESGHYLADKLLMKENVVHEQMEVFDEMELSALKEVGNIITASYLSALASMTNLTILPSVPYICVDMAGAIVGIFFYLISLRNELIYYVIVIIVYMYAINILISKFQNIISTWVVTVRSLYGEYH